MKHTLLYILILFFSATGFYSCKKGPNDPEFSIHSRTARLANDWNVVSGRWEDENSVTEYDGEFFITTTNDSIVDSLPVDLDYAFDRNGIYTRTMITDYPTNFLGNNQPAYTEELKVRGLWNFTGGNETIKEKSQLLIRQTEVSTAVSNSGSAIDVVAYEGQTSGFVYNIDRLAKDEVVLNYTLSTIDKLGTTTVSGEMTLNRK